MAKKIITFLFVFCILSCSGKNKDHSGKDTIEWRAYTYWWWQGNAVDSANIAYNLDMMSKAGIGGAHIVPIYGIRGEENRFLRYLSPEWVKMIEYASQKASELGMTLDMTLGTGWCYGGNWVEARYGTMSAGFEIIKDCKSSMVIDLSPTSGYPVDTVLCVLADYGNSRRIDLSPSISGQKVTLPGNMPQATLYVLRMQGPKTSVKRAAPGAEGPMLNPFSTKSFEAYVEPYEIAFQGNMGKYISSIYHDSYEYFGANWSIELLEKFEASRGYRLQTFLPELLDKGRTELSRRVIADYRQTISELHVAYIKSVKRWAEQNHTRFRNQAHGSPTNWLDTYAVADIPETESFGSSSFKIPKFDRDERYISPDNVPQMDIYKFASSTAHVTGKSLISSEAHTWLREHFRVALSHCKPELDKLFVSGINRIYYHGTAYSPREETWPGWLFYASTNFAPSNSQYCHFFTQNKYIENCQQILRSAKPDNEVLVYFPFQDILHNCNVQEDILFNISVHNSKEWLLNSEFQRTLSALKDNGFGYDYISDLQLTNSNASGGALKTTGNTYKTLIVPKCEYIPLQTMLKLEELLKAGINVIFVEELPRKHSGYSDHQKSQIIFNEVHRDLQNSILPNLKIINLDKLSFQLAEWRNKQEKLASHKLDFIRKKDGDDYIYFISNLNSGEDINDYVPIAAPNKEFILFDPMTGKKGKAKIQRSGEETAVLLQLKPGQSLFLFVRGEESNLQSWGYTGKKINEFTISGNWKLDFLTGGPNLPESTRINDLISWTELPDTMASYFSGLAHYGNDFTLDYFNKNDKYIIVFDKVKESVLIRLNGRNVTTLFSYPFEADISEYLKKGRNHIEFEVANLSANRIRYLDKKKVDWKKFNDINFVDINYERFDASKWNPLESGLIGVVKIICYEKY